MATSFKVVDSMLGGALSDHLRRLRNEGKTLDEMVDAFKEMDIPTSRETLRRWCLTAGVPTHRVAAPVPNEVAS